MGRSKFPGKPSKLVNKKRISVLHGNENNLFYFGGDNNGDDGDYNNTTTNNNTGTTTTTTTTTANTTNTSNDHISNLWDNENGTSTTQSTTTTTTNTNAATTSSSSSSSSTTQAAAALFGNRRNGDSQDFSILQPKEKFQSSEPPDGGGGGCIARYRNSSHFSRVVTRARFITSQHSSSLNSSFGSISTKLEINKKDKSLSFSLSSSSDSREKPVKKKTVTFKNILETSDDAVKKVYNPDNAPLVPIIKKPYGRSFRLSRTDCIVRPSRLTEILKNNANNIDKLNFLKFRSVSPSPSRSSLSSSLSKIMDSSSNVPSLNALQLSNSTLASSATTTVAAKLNCGSSSSTSSSSSSPFPLGGKSSSSSSSSAAVAAAVAANDNSSSRHDSLLVGDKRFILPKRSAHSCRVIKPNKRFLDDMDISSRSTKKSANSTNTSSSSSSIYLKKKSKKQQQQQQQQSNEQEEEEEEGIFEDNNRSINNHNSGSNLNVNNSVNSQWDSSNTVMILNNSTSSLKINNSTNNNCNNSNNINNNNSSNDHLIENGTLLSSSLTSYIGMCGGGGGDMDDNNSEASLVATDDTDCTEEDEDDIRNSRMLYSNSNTTSLVSSSSSKLSSPSTALALGGSNVTMSSNKVILRQPRLQYESQMRNGSGINSGLSQLNSNSFSLSHNSSTSSISAVSPLGSIAVNCGVCGTLINNKPFQPSRKFGIFSCEICRKFISKIIKKLAASSAGSSSLSNNVLQCTKGDGTCLMAPLLKGNTKTFKKVYKERCPACWLKKCIKSFHVPSNLKVRLQSVIPTSLLRDNDQNNITSLTNAFSIKDDLMTSSDNKILQEKSNGSGGNSTTITSNSNNSTTSNLFVNPSSRLFGLSSTDSLLDSNVIGDNHHHNQHHHHHQHHHHTSPKATTLPKSNPLAENNTTFGSSLLIKPTILEKPVFMSTKLLSQQQQQQQQQQQHTNNSEFEKLSSLVENQKSPLMNFTSLTQNLSGELDDISSTKIKLRKKDKESLNNTTSHQTSTLSSATSSNSTSIAGSDAPKRQKIDLKGPRVKHVCRSASIVLGQPIATFPNGDESSQILESIDTPPRPESPNDTEMELTSSIHHSGNCSGGNNVDNDQVQTTCSTCSSSTQRQSPEPTDLGLSPPATPTDARDDDCSQETTNSSNSNSTTTTTTNTTNTNSTNQDIRTDKDTKKSNIINIENDENSKSLTNNRKISSRPSLIEAINNSNNNGGSTGVNSSSSSLTSTSSSTSRNLNAFHRRMLKNQTSPKNSPIKISIDFWENYDPAEISQTGFGLIVTESFKKDALCFLCGSRGLDPLIFCACCCEPYHQYCVEDEYNLKHSSLDDTMNSLIDTTSLSLGDNLNIITNRLNWLCPRCTVCYTCNMSSGSKVKCQKCQKNYHTTCLGTSKRLLGADRPLICANCLKCKSCGTTKVTKFIGNLPMCSQCFKLRKKGNYCPMCQRCYEDHDFDLKMMECGDCQRWVHAKCEGLSDEQYNLLSTLPENIEFICKRCSRLNPQANLWRDAVASEFKSGLLTVVKLLSKRRQACALLKVSPRKITTIECTCQPSSSSSSSLQQQNSAIKKIQFKGFDYLEASLFSNDNEKTTVMDEESQNSEDTTTIDDDVYEFKENNAFNSSNNGNSNNKCFCGARQRQQMSLNAPNLVDVKRKINNGEYVSLAEFNFDMNNVIMNANCDELMIAYKEILSEAFPWFQNETKACTDALEEDMFDSCTFNQSSEGIECDQQVPVTDLPDDVEEYFYTPNPKEIDMRTCMFCRGTGESDSLEESRLLYCGHNSWVHINCALWSAEVFEEIDGSLQNVHSAIARGRMIKCSLCGNRGATVGCNIKSCGSHYHFPCARKSNCAFMTDKTVYCNNHLNEIEKKKVTIETNFEVARPVYVELDRKKKKLVEPSKVKFYIGSLEVKQLGKVLTELSDTNEAIIPVNFLCTRLYWSIKEPWKIVEYTVKTSIQNNLFTFGNDTGRNFTVDHSNNMNMVQLGLAQIARWHNSLLLNEDSENTIFLRQERSVKQLLEAVGQNGGGIGQNINSDEGNTEEEPQNNADLLPPEIKDAIFEDLPHEILDGISMLDIFPKLMIYEDMITIDPKNENYYNNDYSKEVGNISEEDCNDAANNKDLELSNVWPINTGGIVGHVEDAMLSAARPFGGANANGNASVVSGREIKRSKSEIFPRAMNNGTTRSQQRSASLTWSCKLDTSSVKRRKISKGLQDIRLPEGVVLSIGRRKDDFPSAGALERRRGSQNDDIKNKQFTWSAAKKYASQIDVLEPSTEKLKISQLDGMDDLTNESIDLNDFQRSQRIYDSNTIEAPVKCDRCNCTYRTHDSYERHLSTCEPLSTSESESETAPRSPDTGIHSPDITNSLMSLQQPITVMQNFNNALPIANAQNTLNSIQTINSFGQQSTIPFTTANGSGQIQNIQIQNFQSNGIPVNQLNQLNQGISNILLATSQNNTQISSNPSIITANGFDQSFFSSAQNLNHLVGGTITTTPAIPSISVSSSGIQHHHHQQHHHQTQPQLVTVTTADGNQQLLTISAPQAQTLFAAPNKIQQQQNSLIYSKTSQQIRPQGDNKTFSNRTKQVSKIQQSPSKSKQKPVSAAKPIQMKKSSSRQDLHNIPVSSAMNTTANRPIQIINQTVPLVRNSPANTTDTSTQGIVLQQNSTNPHSIIVQQVGNPQNNIVQYLTTDSNQMQYVTMPSAATAGDFKQSQATTPFLTTSPLVQGTFLQTDSSGNLVLTNASSGLQMISTAPIQIAAAPPPPPTQPQVIGTLIQPQALQCGVVSAEQMVLGSTPTLEMVTNPAMLLASQPVYYGLETIVQNTVMSSQQFVSTAMQGVLSQNASFSATTTQVFQASKIEPIMEVPTGYVVLNNVDGTIMQQPTAAQTNIISTNVLQQPIPHIQAQPPQIQTQTIQSQQIPSIYNITTAQPPQQQIQTTSQPTTTIQTHQIQPHQLRAVSPAKPTAKSSPIVVTKIQPQIMKKVIPNMTTVQTTQQTPQPPSTPTIIQADNIATNNPIILSKTIALTTTDQTPIIVQTTATSGANNIAGSKILKSSPISSTTQHHHHHPLKPKTPSTTVSTSNSLMPIQPVQRKTNMIRPLNKISAVTIKPKIVTKPNTVKNSSNMKSSVQSSQPIAPKPTLEMEQHHNSQRVQSQMIAQIPTPMEITDNHQQLMNDERRTFEVPLGSPDSGMEMMFDSGCPIKDQLLSPSAMSTDSTSTSVSSNQLQSFENISNTCNTLFSQQQQLQQNNHQYTLASSNQSLSSSINLPTSSSIQLPSAPFISPYNSSNNIPTNIVNPIQQQINPPPISRPTNRVLPMQTIQHHKLSPPTPPEPKLCTNKSEIMDQDHEKDDLKNVVTSSVFDLIDKADLVVNESSVGSITTTTSAIMDCGGTNTTTEQEQANAAVAVISSHLQKSCMDEELKKRNNSNKHHQQQQQQQQHNDFSDVLTDNAQDNNDFEMKTNDSTRTRSTILTTDDVPDVQDDLSQSTTPEVKEKICEILENLENEDCNKSPLLDRNFDGIVNAHMNQNNGVVVVQQQNHNEVGKDDLMAEHKENVDPDVVDGMNLNKINNTTTAMTMNTLPPSSTLSSSPNKLSDAMMNQNINHINYNNKASCGPRLLYEIQSEDGFTYKSTSVIEIWEKVFEAVQVARKAHGLIPLPEGPLADMCGVQMLGLKTNALRYLIEQLPGVEKCKKYVPKYHKKDDSNTLINGINGGSIGSGCSSGYSSDQDDLKENIYGASRCEPFIKRSEYDMFSWLASRHRKQPIQVVVQPPDVELIPRRGTGSNLPMAMKYRTLKETYKDYVGVFRSQIHGRGLYCTKDIEAGEMVIEYAGELIRSTLTDKRERYYDSKGIGCYMFKIDENLVVDATMRGNAARFINHSCEPNCYSKVVDILGHKHIIIFALRRIVQGEELTYDYKFPFEDVKIPCSCGSKKCRKYLN